MKAGRLIGAYLIPLTLLIGGFAAAQETAPSPETKPTAKKTSLEMKVVGVLAIGEGDDRRSSAIIAMKGSKTSKTYSPGQAIDGNADLKLVKICNERIEFLNQGRLEFAIVRQFPEAGWGGNSPVSTSSPSAAPSPAGSAASEGGSDRLQALREARNARQQRKSPSGSAGRGTAPDAEIVPPASAGTDAEAQP